MTIEPTVPNAEQSHAWNEVQGRSWVTHDALLTLQIRPFGDHALERAAVTPGSRVLDVGCGSGDTTRELARRVGPAGAVTGLDISAPLLDLARARAREEGLAQVTFELADAQTAALPEGAFDLLYSRFGVMFFDDPTAAFTNLARALRPGGRAVFVCWRRLEDNPWFQVPLAAVAQVLTFERSPPGAPGPMAFADPARVRGILAGAGFTDVALEAFDATLTVGGSGSLDEAVEFMTEVGPTASALRSSDPASRPAVVAALRASLAPHHTPEGLRMKGGVWLVTATRP